MKLIINADDFGYTKGVSEGIITGYHQGIIRSTTALTNMEGIAYAAFLAKDAPDLGIGVHLTLTLGNALTKGTTITKDGGAFKSRKVFYEELEQLDRQEVYAEFKAQIERFYEVFDQAPDHLDSHHSVHDANEMLLEVTKQLASEYQLPIRRYSNFTYATGFYGESATVKNMIDILERHKQETGIELMTHPGFCDLDLYRNSSYATHRVQELSVLCDPKLLQYIEAQSIELTNYTKQ